MRTEKYPFDYDALKKGDVIHADTLEGVVRLNREHKNYSRGVCGLAKIIMREMEARGRPVVVCAVGNDLKILTDEEAGPYNRRRKKITYRAQRTVFRNMLKVDTAFVSQDEKARIDRDILVMGAELAAQKKALRNLTVEAHKRQTPAITQQG